MKQHLKTFTVAAAAVTALAIIPAAASASVTIDSSGKGFVPKGDVQSGFGWNNNDLQTKASKVTFSSSQTLVQSLSQNASQAVTQDGSQDGTQSGIQQVNQAGTQDVTEVKMCMLDNGNIARRSRHGLRTGERNGEREATRDATRDASRIGEREGTRYGSRTTTVNGVITADVAYDARQRNQITGFNLTGWKATPVQTVDAPVWGTIDYGAPEQFGDWSFGDWGSFGQWKAASDTPITWGDWDFPTDPADAGNFVADSDEWDTTGDQNADPDVCENNGPHVVPGTYVHTFTGGDIHEGEITYGEGTPKGDIHEGQIHEGVNEDDYHYGLSSLDPTVTITGTTYGAIKVTATYSGPPVKTALLP